MAKLKSKYSVFVSSTYTDMIQYRDAIRNAIIRADCIPYGMERFGAAAIPPLKRCYEEIEKSDIYLCALGMRYGSVDDESQKSYTQLEYEKAEELNLPILAFIIDDKNDAVQFKSSQIETGEGAIKLATFKESIKNSKNVTFSSFISPENLEALVFQSITEHIRRTNEMPKSSTSNKQQSYIDGAELIKRFVKRPEIYKGTEAILRVRIDGNFGGYKLRDELFNAFGFMPGSDLYINDLYTLGAEPDVDDDEWSLDCFASGKAADWLEDNKVHSGYIIEGKFRFLYELVKSAGSPSRFIAPVDTKVAKLQLLQGLSVISYDKKTSKGITVDNRDNEYAREQGKTVSVEQFIEMLQKLNNEPESNNND